MIEKLCESVESLANADEEDLLAVIWSREATRLAGQEVDWIGSILLNVVVPQVNGQVFAHVNASVSLVAFECCRTLVAGHVFGDVDIDDGEPLLHCPTDIVLDYISLERNPSVSNLDVLDL